MSLIKMIVFAVLMTLSIPLLILLWIFQNANDYDHDYVGAYIWGLRKFLEEK